MATCNVQGYSNPFAAWGCVMPYGGQLLTMWPLCLRHYAHSYALLRRIITWSGRISSEVRQAAYYAYKDLLLSGYARAGLDDDGARDCCDECGWPDYARRDDAR